MKKKFFSKLLVVSLLLTFVLAGCSPKETPQAGQSSNEGGTLRYAIWSAPKGVFNPSLYDDIYDGKVNQLIYEPLLSVDSSYKYIPGLADSYTISPDNLTITFNLNKKAKWHDGQAVTAADVEFTLTTICSPDYTGPRYGEINKIAGAKDYHDKKADKVTGIKVLNSNTITVTFEEPFAAGLFNIGAARGIIPKHVWEKVPVADWSKATDLLKAPIGSGPFKMSKIVAGQYVELDRFDDYNLGKPKLDKVILKVSNQETAQAELVKGDLDMVLVSSMKQKDLDVYKNANIQVSEYTGQGYQYMGVNIRNDIFKDKKVRQALMYGINRKSMVDSLLEGHGTVVNAPLLKSSWAYPDQSQLNNYDYNPEKAKQLLKEAGWTEKDGMMYKDGKPFKITLKYPTGNKPRELSAPIIQQDLKKIGVDVQLVSMEFSTLSTQVMKDHDFDMFLMGWSLEVDPDSKMYWHSSLVGANGWNMVGFVNSQNDKLLEDGNKETDINKRKAIYQEWAKLMNDEVPGIFLYSPNDAKAYTPKLKGFKPYTFVEYPSIQNWYIEK